MEFSIKSKSPEKQRSACLVAGVFESRALSPAARRIDEAAHGVLSNVLARGDMDGKKGTTLLLHDVPHIASPRVLLVGLGPEKEFGEKEFSAAVATALKALETTGAADATLYLAALPVKKRDVAWRLRQAALAAQDALYRYERFKSKKSTPPPLSRLGFAITEAITADAAEQALVQGLAIAEGIALAKDLGNTPGNVCTPTYLAEAAQQLAHEHALDCEILEREDMEHLGMHALLSVAKGSYQPPKFIVLHYKGGRSSAPPFVLVGKGITFDTGGISLKPGAEMDEMKFDMCGAASVLGALAAVARLKLAINLIVLVPAAENMPGGGASKPGDIVTAISGQSIEILNTDAEGRLILCDALSFAERFKPQAVIDAATLTGACVIALGHVASGLYANDDTLAQELLLAGDEAFDRVWRMPLWDDYQEALKSPFADLANVGGRPAGSVTAACFLSRFAEKYAWAHLDIAGTAWKSGTQKGATGRPVALLAHYLLARAESPKARKKVNARPSKASS